MKFFSVSPWKEAGAHLKYHGECVFLAGGARGVLVLAS